VSSSLGWGKGFGEEFAGMLRKKRNKRSNAHDMMDISFKSVVHALRLSGIEIPENVLLPSQLPAPASRRKKMCMAVRKKMCMTARKNMRMTATNMRVVESKIIGMPTVMKRIKCIVIVDHLCWTDGHER
jgi:hypothetical protein